MVFDEKLFDEKPIIKVIGIGGAGGNAVDRMIQNDVRGVTFVAMNTDAQVLKLSKAEERIQLGRDLTKGLGAGADLNVGRMAAEESKEDIEDILDGVDMVFITAGMGGGTGTGAAPVVARLAKSRDILTVGIVTKPFSFEGVKRAEAAKIGIKKLKEEVDTLIIVPNDRLIEMFPPDKELLSAFRDADNVLRSGIQSIADLIMFPSLINIDFADVRTVMKNQGAALMGIGSAKGDNRAVAAARNAVQSSLLEMSIDGATNAIVNIAANEKLTIHDMMHAIDEIKKATDSDFNMIYGTTINEALGDELVVTVIATGYELKQTPTAIDKLTEVYLDEHHPNVDTKEDREALEDDGIPSWLKNKGSL